MARPVAVAALLLFAFSAWPSLLVQLPPLQDLPNHVATAHIIAHPQLYPEFAFNGLFKSNALMTLWMLAFGRFGLFGAARAFTVLVLAVNAVALPVFIVRLAGRRALPVAMLFVWPLVHSFNVSMGMLNFACAFGLSLMLLAVIDEQREQATLARGLAVAALAVVVWYAHPFPLAVVGGLVALHAVTRPTWPARAAATVALLLPLVPAGVLSAVAALHHLVKAEHSSASPATYLYLTPQMTLAHLWLDVSGALTRWGSSTLVPAALLPLLAWRRRDKDRPFLSNAALLMLAIAYVALPVMLSNWNYLNCRMVPYLWVGLALRLPERLPRPLLAFLAVCALWFSVALGVDYVRLDRDRAAFTAGVPAVPARATLLPLMFEQSRTSEFTASLTHAWGYYTVARDTSAPLVFAVERSYPITYREFPPRQLIPPALDEFAKRNATAGQICERLGQVPADEACRAAWRALWSGFWADAEPHFSHVLTWAMPAETRGLIPPPYRRVFASGDLEIYARQSGPTQPSK